MFNLSIILTALIQQTVPLSTDTGVEDFIVAIIGFGFGAFILYTGIKRYQKSQLIKNTPTEKVQSMAVGRTELEGTGKPIDETLDAPFSDDDCFYMDWVIKEYKKGPGDDNKKWKIIASGADAIPFLLEDGTGEVVIDADTSATWTLKSENTDEWRTKRRDGPPNKHVENFCETQKGVSASTRRKRKYEQTILEPGEDVYVLGEATPRDVSDDSIEVTEAGERLKIEEDDASGFFIISNKGENELQRYYRIRGPLYMLGGIALTGGSLYYFLALLGL